MKKIKQKAVALSYKKGYPAPQIVAKGEGITAEKILAAAEKEGVAVVENSELADVLFTADIYSLIPEEQYEIVAEILSFVIKI